jgi:hypothetical protein
MQHEEHVTYLRQKRDVSVVVKRIEHVTHTSRINMRSAGETLQAIHSIITSNKVESSPWGVLTKIRYISGTHG